ncbi:hypothetical protein ACA910_022690 [Epithemia clementina (nom. ined.)]
MLAFRNEAGLKPATSISSDGIIASSVNIFVICSHYLVRILCELGALWTVCRSAFWSTFWNMWTLFDLFAMVLTIVTVVQNQLNTKFLNGLNAFVVGLLWIKVLAFLKVVNKEMATFVLALTQILADIRLFMIVLFVCVCMFGDMFHVAVWGEDDGNYCKSATYETDTMEDFCSSSWESYLRTYSILLGDFELDDVTGTTGSSILFVIFTIIGVIVLLNVLIAIISDSYEKAILSSHVLFGKARVMFVAQNDALESFLRPTAKKPTHRYTAPGQPNDSPEVSDWRTLKRIGRWAVMVVILGTTIFTQIYLIDAAVVLSDAGNEDIPVFIACVFLGVLLFAGIWVAVLAAFDGPLRDHLPPTIRYGFDNIDYFNRIFVKVVSSYLFGLKQG